MIISQFHLLLRVAADDPGSVFEMCLTNLEAGMTRVTAALPSLVSKDGRQVQPRLAGRDDLACLPVKVWEAKPGMFTKP